jgi:hypothetical protein
MQFSERYVLKLILKKLLEARRHHKKHPDSDGHMHHMHHAHKMLQDYFAERGYDPNAQT